MTSYNGGGFTQGDDGTIFGNPGSDPGSASDYSSWDWKQIEAAVFGMAAGPDSVTNRNQAKSVADPASLEKAAQIFFYVHDVLSGIALSLTDQTKALAGSDGPWKGAAADSFVTMIDTFSKQVAATADVLSGGSQSTDSVYQQLADNAITLDNAQKKIIAIDLWYAQEARNLGVNPMSNGLIPISQKPELVAMMNDDMRTVLKNLASEYRVTVDSIRAPAPITPPVKDPGTDTTNKDGPKTDDTGKDGPNTGGGAGGGPKLTTVPPPTANKTAPESQSFPGGLGLGGGTGGSKGGTGSTPPPATVPPFPGGTGLGNLDLSGLDHLLNPLGSGLGLRGLKLPSSSPSAFDGNLASDGLPGQFGRGSRFPGVGDLGSRTPTGPVTESGLPEELSPPRTTMLSSSGPGAGEGISAAGAGAGEGGTGMPMMPLGGGAGQQTPTDRSDASGLIDADGEPWEGLPEADEEVGSTLGATAGGAVLGLPGEQLAEELTIVQTVGPGTVLGAATGGGTGPTTSAERGGRDAHGEGAGRPDTEGSSWNEPWTGEFDDLGSVDGTSAAAVPAEGRENTTAPAATPTAPTQASPAPAPTVGSDGAPLPVGPAAPPVLAGAEEAGSSADWDVAGAAFVPLLWTAPTENEPEVTLAGRAREGAATWGGGSDPTATVAGTDLNSPGPAWATWQPVRTSAAAAGAGASPPSAVQLSCGVATPEQEQAFADEDAARLAAQERAESKAAEPAPGIPDLLVQERNAWGAPASQGPDALA
ncbi:WXG100 family type VII secretion target [Streptomyces sp. NPDC091209]|uniref:WXG100 family type VII secretion target n=1 Tax=Streptomyces sp. NPDC091209 TaxID=3365974 RepID=UPI0037FE5545